MGMEERLNAIEETNTEQMSFEDLQNLPSKLKKVKTPSNPLK
jgi:hypothetical protein